MQDEAIVQQLRRTLSEHGEGIVAAWLFGSTARGEAGPDSDLGELRTMARPEALETDVRERRFVEHTLQIAIQACQNVASHVVSDERLGEPRTNQELMDLLVAAGWLEAGLGKRLRQAIGFRNVVVYGYDAVDLDVLRDILTHRLDDLSAFVEVIRTALPEQG